MKKIDKKNWRAKTERLNEHREIKRGMLVTDGEHMGVVVKIVPGHDIEDHGTIFVWQSERDDYGADNCEHYVHFGWKSSLRIIDDIEP